MADAYWRYNDPRQQQPPPPQQPQLITPPAGKRSRSNLDVPGAHELANHYPCSDDRGVLHGSRDTESINASCDRYLRNAISSYGGSQPARTMTGGVSGHHVDDPRNMGIAAVHPRVTVKDPIVGYEDRRLEVSLPPDATSTLYVEGLPANCMQREVAHIFRPFVGYEEVRLVKRESRLPGRDQLVLCFVDFRSPAHAATALDALQGLDAIDGTITRFVIPSMFTPIIYPSKYFLLSKQEFQGTLIVLSIRRCCFKPAALHLIVVAYVHQVRHLDSSEDTLINFLTIHALVLLIDDACIIKYHKHTRLDW